MITKKLTVPQKHKLKKKKKIDFNTPPSNWYTTVNKSHSTRIKVNIVGLCYQKVENM